jgi:hypothetical protein
VYLKDGTLIVAFLGDRRTGARLEPRLFAWREHGAAERVRLGPAAARMAAQLALPEQPSLGGAGPQARADRLAAAFGAALTRRSAEELRDTLGCARTHEWRIRKGLIAELTQQGLEDHLVRERGRIGLRDAISDVAALVCAVRHGEREVAMRLVEVLTDGAGDEIGWLLGEPWPAAARAMGDDAIDQVRQWRAEPRLLPVPAAGTESHPSAPATPPGTQIVEPRPTLATGPRQRSRIRSVAGFAALALVVGVGAAALLGRGSSEAVAPLPGAWPTSGGHDSARLANLTNDIPLAVNVAARRGDTVLLRMRLPKDQSTRRRVGPVGVSASLEGLSSEGIRLYTTATGFKPRLRQGTVSIATGSADERLRVISATTELVDSGGRVLRSLPDLRLGRMETVGKLDRGTTYFVDSELRVVRAPAGSPGQIGSESNVRCGKTTSSAEPLTTHRGAEVSCIAHLINLGPSTLPSVELQIGRYVWPRSRGAMLALEVTARAASAEPESTCFSQTVALSSDGPTPAVSFVPKSAELFNASFEPERNDLDLTERPRRGEVTIGPLEPGADRSVFLRFKARIG